MPSALAADHGGQFVDISVSREGCVIAARTKDVFSISWDGGASFTEVDAVGNAKAAAAADRVAVLLDDNTLGTFVPGKPLERHAPAKLAYQQVLANAGWTVLVSEKLVAVTDDHGVTWRYIEPPKDATIQGLDGDRLIGYGLRPTSDPDGEHIVDYIATTYTYDLRHPGWHAAAGHLGTPIDEEARYSLTGDKFWGCGGSDKLLELATGKELIGDLRTDVWPTAVHSTHGVTFASLSNGLYRLRGASATKIDDINDGEVVGVDAAGTPIVRTGGQLLRWSKAGGWRVLLDATP